jgi:hypothetical protein
VEQRFVPLAPEKVLGQLGAAGARLYHYVSFVSSVSGVKQMKHVKQDFPFSNCRVMEWWKDWEIDLRLMPYA